MDDKFHSVKHTARLEDGWRRRDDPTITFGPLGASLRPGCRMTQIPKIRRAPVDTFVFLVSASIAPSGRRAIDWVSLCSAIQRSWERCS